VVKIVPGSTILSMQISQDPRISGQVIAEPNFTYTRPPNETTGSVGAGAALWRCALYWLLQPVAACAPCSRC
jgi:hypothetical protein